MMEQDFQRVYEKFKLQFFRRLFSQVREREGSLSAMEAFSVEVIHQLNAPTIGRFADFLGISQSNATYKVNNLIRKGYIVKENSDTDRREYHLKLSDKFYSYNGLMQSYIDTVLGRIRARFTPEELATFAHVLAVMSDELMPSATCSPSKHRHENGDSLAGCLRFSFAGVQALCARCAVFLCLRAKCGLIREENYDRNGASP